MTSSEGEKQSLTSEHTNLLDHNKALRNEVESLTGEKHTLAEDIEAQIALIEEMMGEREGIMKTVEKRSPDMERYLQRDRALKDITSGRGRRVPILHHDASEIVVHTTRRLTSTTADRYVLVQKYSSNTQADTGTGIQHIQQLQRIPLRRSCSPNFQRQTRLAAQRSRLRDPCSRR